MSKSKRDRDREKKAVMYTQDHALKATEILRAGEQRSNLAPWETVSSRPLVLKNRHHIKGYTPETYTQVELRTALETLKPK